MKTITLVVGFLLLGVASLLAMAFVVKAFDSHESERICTREFMPVCGIDGVTYSNKCEAGNVEIAHEGECDVEGSAGDLASGPCELSELPSEKISGEVCSTIYAPVCGIDGITYGNVCMAGSIAVAHEGECK